MSFLGAGISGTRSLLGVGMSGGGMSKGRVYRGEVISRGTWDLRGWVPTPSGTGIPLDMGYGRQAGGTHLTAMLLVVVLHLLSNQGTEQATHLLKYSLFIIVNRFGSLCLLCSQVLIFRWIDFAIWNCVDEWTDTFEFVFGYMSAMVVSLVGHLLKVSRLKCYFYQRAFFNAIIFGLFLPLLNGKSIPFT